MRAFSVMRRGENIKIPVRKAVGNEEKAKPSAKGQIFQIFQDILLKKERAGAKIS